MLSKSCTWHAGGMLQGLRLPTETFMLCYPAMNLYPYGICPAPAGAGPCRGAQDDG